MTMTNWEIVRHYLEAKDRKADIRILADLNATDKDAIIRILEDAGEIVPGARRERKLVDEIKRLYDRGLRDREIADKLGCSKNTVSTYRNRNGLSCHSQQKNLPGECGGKIGPLYEQGMTDRQISEELGCSKSNVAQWRLRRGLPPNSGPVFDGPGAKGPAKRDLPGRPRRKGAGHQEERYG